MKHSFNMTSEMEKSSKVMQQNYSYRDAVIHDVTEWPQSSPSKFLDKWKMNIFCNNWKADKDIIVKLGVHLYHDIINMSL